VLLKSFEEHFWETIVFITSGFKAISEMVRISPKSSDSLLITTFWYISLWNSPRYYIARFTVFRLL